MKTFKSIMLGALLAAPMMAGAVTTTGFSGIDMAGNGDITGTAGFTITSGNGTASAAGNFTTTTGQTRSATVTLDTSGQDTSSTTFTDTWTLGVGTNEIASIVFDKLTSPVTFITAFSAAANPVGTPVLTSSTSGDLYTFSNIVAGNYTFTVSGTRNGINPTTGNPGGQYQVSTSVVSAVPVPAAVWMMGTGLLGLISFRKRKSGLQA